MSTSVRPGTPQQSSRPRTVALVAVQSRIARDSAVRILRALGATDVIAATSLDEARRAAAGRPGEYAVVEASLPDGSGSALARDLRLAGWRRIIVLSSDDDHFTSRGALHANVTCFLQLPLDQSSQRPMVPAQAGPDRAPMGSHPVGDSPTSTLSRRELEVLQLVADGKSNKEVGEALDLSALTVKSHLARIAKKLGTGDRAELVIIALRAGAIQ